MILKFTRSLIVFSVLFFAGQAYSQKFEAENATLDVSVASPAYIMACDSCSNGKVVSTRETGFTLPINVTKEAKYNVYIKVSAAYGQKVNTVKLDDLTASLELAANPAYLRVKIMSNLKLTAGTHTFSFIKSWGWVNVDYIELEEVQAAFSAKLEAEDGTLTPLANGAEVISCATCSGGKAVSTKDSGFKIDAVISKAANYNIYLMVASPNGNKTNILTLNPGTSNALSVDFSTTEAGYVKLKVVSNQKLTAGTHVIEISKSWGWVNVDYIELEEVVGARFNLTQTLSTPNPTDEAACLYNYLLQNYGKKIISGVMTLASFDETNKLKTQTGKEPGLMGLDFMHNNRGYGWYDEQLNLKDAKTWTAKNGIVAMTWHWRDPLKKTEGFYVPDGKKPANEVTNFDVSKVNDPSSAEYKAMVSDIDAISVRLKEFQDNKIPVLWRPLHEAAGGWFWWGAKSGADLQKLWRLMYDRMVNVNGLRNLIWVWTNNGNDEQWYPGDAYVDVVGVDIYGVDGDHGSQILKFNSLNERYQGKKILALTEVGTSSDADLLVRDEAAWSWYMPWYGEFASGNLEKYTNWDLWKKNFGHDYVLTLDEMPALKDICTVTSVDGSINTDAAFEVYPTLIEDQLTIKAADGVSSVTVYNAMGDLIGKFEGNRDNLVMPFSEQRPGIYFVVVNEVKTFKVIKK
ncbi:glycosyl hydrolase [Sporocytophaga myxococcoides]|uniref:glycosyl hydrolase n=1 Tax=Sporocytophaga myxococcoides TaxID=153721 RepID=UPI00040EC778|nr:glycosyl hydrolase [Sporocytophaga myxococcoides]